MIVFAKKILYKLLSQKSYLRTLHRGFYMLYSLGILKNDARFKYHYMVKSLIEPTDTIVDIGANLGYFSKTFARLATHGQLISIEPVKPFYETLQYFIGKRSNVTIHHCALGNEEGTITMVLPESNGMIRTGLPHIATSEDEKKAHKNHEVNVYKGSQLLKDIEKINYIKCDIEGYETVVFNEMKTIIEQHLPMVQIEIGPENEKTMLSYFVELGYLQYGIANFKIVRELEGKQKEQGDFLFVHQSKAAAFEEKMKLKGKF